MRFILAALAVAAFATPIGAAPLCRDSKGLFTPCTGERVPTAPRHRRIGSDAGARPRSDAASPDTADVRPARPPIVGRGKLCRDSKGLFKPC
jgi:hypothetical protein